MPLSLDSRRRRSHDLSPACARGAGTFAGGASPRRIDIGHRAARLCPALHDERRGAKGLPYADARCRLPLAPRHSSAHVGPVDRVTASRARRTESHRAATRGPSLRFGNGAWNSPSVRHQKSTGYRNAWYSRTPKSRRKRARFWPARGSGDVNGSLTASSHGDTRPDGSQRNGGPVSIPKRSFRHTSARRDVRHLRRLPVTRFARHGSRTFAPQFHKKCDTSASHA
jgi:hypothetical protein